MITKPLYKYTREGGGITVSPNKPDCEYTEMYRLIADEGMILVNSEVQTICVDVEKDDAENWTEIEAPEEPTETDEPVEEEPEE